MKFFAFFIHRPVATCLLTVAITLAGLLGLRLLPVAALPKLDLPVIMVTASLPGASPETMASSVATPLERSLGSIAGLSQITSTSSLGSTHVIMVFDYERDINGAARDVQAAINAAQSLLPSGMPKLPSYRKFNPADAPVMVMALTSDDWSPGQLYDYASTQLAQNLLQVEGVGDVNVGGSSLPAVRVELNPLALFNQGIALDAVRNAISDANIQRPQGALEDQQQRWQLKTSDDLKTASQWQPLVVHHKDGAAIRLEDIATVSDSVEDLHHAGMYNGRPSVLLIIRKAPEANLIETVERIRDSMPALRAMAPSAINIDIALDRSATIRASVDEVEQSLVIAVGLVILVVFLFLRSGRATFIPAVAVPVSLIGTFAAMYLCDFSLNNLSLMALTIATGFVVDDAIVVLENISRHLEAGVKPFAAALKGVREVGFTVLSMSISLIAVFIPLFLVGNILGSLFREFAVTLTVAILISLVISVTLTPMMCAWLLPAAAVKEQPRIKGFNKLLLWIQRGYARSLEWSLNHRRWVLLTLPATFALTIYMFIIVPKTFFPDQDTGTLRGSVSADQSISFQAMRTKLRTFMELVREDPAVENVVGFTGGSGVNQGTMFITLKAKNQRTESAKQVISRLRKKMANQAGATLSLMPVQDLPSSGPEASASYQYSLLSDDLDDLRKWEPRIRQAFSKLPELADVSSDQQDRGSEIAIVYDRDAMSRLGIDVTEANALLNNAFGQRQISTIYQPRNQYKVVMTVAPEYAQDVSALDKMFVINKDGESIPLSAFAHWLPANSPLSVNHEDLSASSTISFNLAEGVSLSQAATAIEKRVVSLGIPSSVRGSFSGTAQEFEESQGSQLWLMLAAIATVYIVLGMLYESYVHPLTILSTLPSAGVGALLALELFSTPFSLIAMIGIMLLIGIVKKNAIIMVDFAIEVQRNSQINARDAIFQASTLRFRPIIMTTLAALFGALPLVLAQGDGSELRQPLGITIAGGLVMSQLLTLYTTPVVYIYMDKLRRRKNRNLTAPSAVNHPS